MEDYLSEYYSGIDDGWRYYDDDGYQNITDCWDKADPDCRQQQRTYMYTKEYDGYEISRYIDDEGYTSSTDCWDKADPDCWDQWFGYWYASDRPEIIFHILGICSATLSVIGSFAILLKILRGIRSTSPYDRFLLGLSTFDIVASITMLVDHCLVPNKTTFYSDMTHMDKKYGTMRESCIYLNPLSKAASLLSVWYNGLLSVYFLLRVLSQLKRRDLVKKYEPWLHSSGILVVALIVFFLFTYSDYWGRDNGSTCYFMDSKFLYNTPYGPLFWFSCSLIIINYSVIYAIVRKTLGSNHGGPSSQQHRRKREITTVMILYVGSFFVTYTPFLVWAKVRFKTRHRIQDLYPLRLLVAATFPLQGFLNAFIYFKPAYARVRASHPSKSIIFVLHQVLWSRSTPKSHPRRDGPRVTAGSVAVTNLTRTDLSSADPTDSNAANTEEDAGDGITGVDFGLTVFPLADPAAEDDSSPLEAVAEEESVDSN